LYRLQSANPAGEVTERLDLHKLRDKNWFIQGTVATAGDGLYEGLDWLQSNFSSLKRNKLGAKV
jgi:hypothetical protein